MKKIKWIGSFLVITAISMVCSAQNMDSVNTTSNLTSPESELEISEISADYAVDWNAFKQAVKSKNESELRKYTSENIQDLEGLLFLLNDLFIIKKLDETAFEALESENIGGVDYLKLHAEEISIEDGYDVRNTVTLFFLQRDTGLVLELYRTTG